MSDHPDGMDYLLARITELHRKLPVASSFLEVGSYEGETTCDVIRILAGSERWLFTIDPYGAKPYLLEGEYWGADMTKYTDATYRRAVRTMAVTAEQHNVNHAYYRMTSLEFFRFLGQVDFWFKGRQYPVEFGFVYLDGAHDPATVHQEVDWLLGHMKQGLIVVDDWHYVKELPFRGEVVHDRCYIQVPAG